MKSFLIAANWKMNGDPLFISDFMRDFSASYHRSPQQEIIFLPPFVYLRDVYAQISSLPQIYLGAQNVSEFAAGAYTGEISPAMLKSVSCQYVLVGHSERRTLFHETNQIVAKKYKAADEAGLVPILCVGETWPEREEGRAFEVIETQLEAVFTELKGEDIARFVIAYEPVWAIGTGKTALPQQAQEIHSKIRDYVAQCRHITIEKVQLLYGGSLNPQNAEALFLMPDIDGGLIGGASLKVEQFLSICEIARQVSDSCNL